MQTVASDIDIPAGEPRIGRRGPITGQHLDDGEVSATLHRGQDVEQGTVHLNHGVGPPVPTERVEGPELAGLVAPDRKEGGVDGFAGLRIVHHQHPRAAVTAAQLVTQGLPWLQAGRRQRESRLRPQSGFRARARVLRRRPTVSEQSDSGRRGAGQQTPPAGFLALMPPALGVPVYPIARHGCSR